MDWYLIVRYILVLEYFHWNTLGFFFLQTTSFTGERSIRSWSHSSVGTWCRLYTWIRSKTRTKTIIPMMCEYCDNITPIILISSVRVLLWGQAVGTFWGNLGIYFNNYNGWYNLKNGFPTCCFMWHELILQTFSQNMKSVKLIVNTKS